MDLDSLKYSELQALAKALGLKANGKAEKLLKALKQHYNKEEKQEEHEQNHPGNVGQGGGGPPHPVRGGGPREAVTPRRRTGNRTKRKISDTVEDSAEVAAGPAGPENVEAKRTKAVSLDQEQQATENQQQQQEAEAPVTEKPQKAAAAAAAGKIPRLQKSKLKPVTPNFQKLHEAQFNKMESIDSFFQRKTKQMETWKNSVEVKKTRRAGPGLFSPAAPEVPLKRRAGKTEVPFRPSVLSTRRINVRFSEATFDNEHKKSLIKTPARMSPCVASSTPRKPAVAVTPKAPPAPPSSTKTPKPFLFTGNNNNNNNQSSSVSATPGTQRKQSFDLKASLSRPLGYKPHTGKLKPFGEVNKPPPANLRQESYKSRKVESRDERRTKIMSGRKHKKENLLDARRGLL